MNKHLLGLSLIFIAVIISGLAGAGQAALDPSRIVRGVEAEGSCAVVGMSAEQSQLIALQRARAAAIEQAAGVKIQANTLVTNGRLSADFIRTYSKGFIVGEKVWWLHMGQYQKDSSTAPIPEYRVKILADVYRPEKKIEPIGLDAKLNSSSFRSGEKAKIEVNVEREAKIAIFNITADDKVVMLFPNEHSGDNVISDGMPFMFPSGYSNIELVVRTLPNHKRDAEALFVAVMDMGHERDFGKMFKPLETMEFSTFFSKYSEVSEYCEDVILTYEVVGK
jgi:hypothetical protein